MTGYDVIVVGAGSIGLPTTYYLAAAGLSVATFDGAASPGRGENRAAIGGIRATHSEPAKALLCRESLAEFSTWHERTGDDIEWRRGGYLFVAYEASDERALRSIVATQQGMGLDIAFVSPEKVAELVPGIDAVGLRGGTYAPGDGSASPLAAAHSFAAAAFRRGARIHFGETVTGIEVAGGRVHGVVTTKGRYGANIVINAAGAAARSVGAQVGLDLPVTPDSHEAGITEPVAPFLAPMLVDLRRDERSKNVYFYQNRLGQLVFCVTPDPPAVGTDRRSTSEFLPLAASRLVALVPRLSHLKVRRTWRGLYPSTPDGSPLLGWAGPTGHLAAVGMCGQGFMLGPGIGRLIARMVTGATTALDDDILHELRIERSFATAELLA